MATVITTALEKGGTSKTTSVVNIATIMAMDGKRVLVVDVDPQANSTYMLTTHKKNDEFYKGIGLYNMLRTYDEDSDISKYIHPTTVDGLDIIASNAQTPMALGQLELLAAEYIDAAYKFLAYSLAKVSDNYDYIIIDTPPTRDDLTKSALFVADYVLIPCRCDEFSLDGMETTLKMIYDLQKNEGMAIDVLGILLTQVERTAVTTLTIETLQNSEYKELLFDTRIRKSSVVAESTITASPVVLYAKASNPSKDYKALYKEILGRLERKED